MSVTPLTRVSPLGVSCGNLAPSLMEDGEEHAISFDLTSTNDGYLTDRFEYEIWAVEQGGSTETLLGTVDHGSIDAGNSVSTRETVFGTLRVQSGDQTDYEIEARDAVGEADEISICGTTTVYQEAPVFRITECGLEPPSGTIGPTLPVWVDATVENNGLADGTATIEISANGQRIETIQRFIAENDDEFVSTSFEPGDYGISGSMTVEINIVE